MSFFAELRRRNVFRVGFAYAIATWVLLQITDVITPILALPEWAPKLIFVILAIGFVPAIIFAWAFEMTPEGIRKEKDVDRSESITTATGQKLNVAIIVTLALAVGLLLVDRFSGEQASDQAREIEKSIAVLPFVNMSSDAEQEFFSDGISEEILNALAAVKELKVAGRTSSFAFKGQNQDLRKIGDTLGVEHILEGSVRKSGTMVRITAQLIQVDDGFHLWSETYDRELTNIFAIQDEIATEILKQLKAQLLPDEQQQVVSDRTTTEVYDLYLLAKQRIYERNRHTLEAAVELLDNAIAADPNYAPAYAQRGIATLLLSDQSYGTIVHTEASKQAKRFIDTALEKNSQLAEAWAGLGLYYAGMPSEHENAIDALTRALSLNPNLINASNWLYNALMDSGDPKSALQLVEQMLERDPLYRPAFGNAVNTFNDFGQHDKAQALLERFRRYDPNDAQLLRSDAMQHFYQGQAAEGYRLAERGYQLAPTVAPMQFAFSVGLLQTGQVARLVEEGGEGFRIDALDALGRRDEAFALAFELASEGYLGGLFPLYNRAHRSQELLDYLEERWPGLESFAADYPHDTYGYGLMLEVAMAYSRSGNTERFDQALLLVENAVEKLSDQGIDNFVSLLENAKYRAMAGEQEAALTALEAAVERGLLSYAPLATNLPVFEALQDEPRFIALEAKMIDNINVQREALGLAAVDPLVNNWPDSPAGGAPTAH